MDIFADNHIVFPIHLDHFIDRQNAIFQVLNLQDKLLNHSN